MFILFPTNISLCASNDNCLSKNYYEAKNVVSTLNLNAQKIDCCELSCMLYYKDGIQLTKCKFCCFPRYFPPRDQKGRCKNVSIKRIFYLSIIPILQRLYASMELLGKQDDILKIKNMMVYYNIHVIRKLGNTLIMNI